MLLYRLQDRIFSSPKGTKLLFPNDVAVQITLEPTVAFGGVEGPSRNVVAGSITAHFNLSTGRAFAVSPGGLFEPLQSSVEVQDTYFEIQANRVVVTSRCESLQDLQDLVSALYYAYPTVLNLYFPDAPVPISADGFVGKTPFKWDYESKQIILSTVVTSKENQENIAKKSWERVALFSGVSNRRLIGSLYYFHSACRLIAAGVNKFEFMSEALLNFSRSLQSLFGETRDEIRAELKKLTVFSDGEIEAKFITAIVLRNEFDVAHVSLSSLDREQLSVLHYYTQIAETAFRKLLQEVISRIENGTYSPPDDPNPILSPDKSKILDKIKKNIEPYISE